MSRSMVMRELFGRANLESMRVTLCPGGDRADLDRAGRRCIGPDLRARLFDRIDSRGPRGDTVAFVPESALRLLCGVR